jgi:hypothetical protein
MQRGEDSRAKWARLLSQNQTREIVMDPDSDEEKYYASADMEDEEEPRPPSRPSSSSQPRHPDFSPKQLNKSRDLFLEAFNKIHFNSEEEQFL